MKRRTKKDVRHLYDCFCQAWESDNIERTRRIEAHGWVENVWVRDYDNVARMIPTDRGKRIVNTYRETDDFDSVPLQVFFDEI